MAKYKLNMSTRKASVLITLFGLLWVAGSTYAYVNVTRLREEGVAVTATYFPDANNPKYIEHSSCGGKRSGGSCNYYVTYEYLGKTYKDNLIGKSAQGSIIPSPIRHIPRPGEEVDAIVDPKSPDKIYYAPYVTGKGIWAFLTFGGLILFGGLWGAVYYRHKTD